jgi:hypothetical protein
VSTTTAQGTRCGNHGKERIYHANSREVRACYAAKFAPKPVSAPPTPSSQPTNADEARTAANRRLASSEAPQYPASDKQLAFLRDLANEVLIDEVRDFLLPKMDTLSAAEAKQLITDMLVMRTAKRQRDAEHPATAEPAKPDPQSRAARNALVEKVMEGHTERNFCIIHEDGKARFYRMSKRGKRSTRPGTWKIQERVSDSLFPRYDSMLGTVAQAIIDQGGAKKAGERFAQLLHKCYECGASLTDTTGNPYYAMGLGPECGAK